MPDTQHSPFQDGLLYLTEAGTETEVLYKEGYELPHFAMWTLLDNPEAMERIGDMYRRYLDVAAENETGIVLCGFDYRASPDWAALLDVDRDGLREVIHRGIGFLRDVSDPYRDRVPHILLGGSIGPRGDAYSRGEPVTADSAEEYHSFQIACLKEAGADIACAHTFNNIPEAVGVARAARAEGLPLAMYFSLDSSSRLNTGPSLRDAVIETDSQTGNAPLFYGLNCSHPVEFEPALEPGDWIDRLRSIRPNASKMEKIALCKLGHLEDGDPDELGAQMGDLARRYPHMDIMGGCCGTDERHLSRIAEAVKAARAG